MSRYRFSVEYLDLNVDWSDSGAWRGYYLYSHGDNIDQLVENATVEEIDQDGGTLDSYSIDDASRQVARAAFKALTRIAEGR